MPYAALPFVALAACIFLGRRVATLVVIFVYLTFDGLLKLLSNYHPLVHVGSDILVLGLAGWWTLEAVMQRRAALRQQPLQIPIALFATWAVLQLLNPYNPALVPAIASFKVHLASIPLYFMVPAVVRERRDAVRFVVALVLLACIPSVAALAQYALGPASVLDLSARAWQNVSYYYEWRPFGTSAVPGGASVFAFLFVPLALALVALRGLGGRLRAAALGSLLLGAGAFVVSGVRQTMLGAVLAMLVFAGLLATRGRSRGVVALVMILLLSAGVFVAVQQVLMPLSTEAVAKDPRSPDIWRRQDVTNRMRTLAETGTYLKSRTGGLATLGYRAVHFPFGAGLGRTGSGAGALERQINADPRSAEVQRQIGWADNYYADLVVEVGVPGLLLMVWIMVGFVVTAVRVARRASDAAGTLLSAALAGLLSAYLVLSWGSSPLMGTPTLPAFWAFAGLVVALRRLEADADGGEPAPAGAA